MRHQANLVLMAFSIIAGCASQPTSVSRQRGPVVLSSPNGRLAILADASEGVAKYQVQFDAKPIVWPSTLGLDLVDAPLGKLKIVDVRRATHDSTYELPVGKASRVRDHANTTTITFREIDPPSRTIELELRAYDEGVAFRYRVPKRDAWNQVRLRGEETRFVLPGDTKAWVLPLPDINSHYEFEYVEESLDRVAPKQLIGFPLLMRSREGIWSAILEADVKNYPGMALIPDRSRTDKKVELRAELAKPRSGEEVAAGETPFETPWRILLVGDSPAPLVESNLATTLAEPNRIGDTSWIKPGKVSFLWWNGYVVGIDADGKPIRGGVDTATCIKYVDFAADNGIPYASLDGLDVAWYGGPLNYNGQDLTTGHAPNLDVQAVLKHAKERGVRIRLWMDSKALRPQLDKALAAFERWGVEGIMVDFIEHEDQDTTRWIAEVAEKAAKHHLTVSLHNVAKPTGLTRTFPNLLTYEAVRNQEWNKFDAWGSRGSTPRHEATVPFTRMLAGPLDFHMGGFRSVLPKDYAPHDLAPVVMGTRAHQVAMYVVYEDPLPMIVDYPEAYRGQPEFKFLVDLPTVWDETRYLAGDVGQFITIARRKGDDWYVGSMAGDGPQRYRVPLGFLSDGRYQVEGFRDGPADQPNRTTPEPAREVTAHDFLDVEMSPAGGHVVRLKRIAN